MPVVKVGDRSVVKKGRFGYKTSNSKANRRCVPHFWSSSHIRAWNVPSSAYIKTENSQIKLGNQVSAFEFYLNPQNGNNPHQQVLLTPIFPLANRLPLLFKVLPSAAAIQKLSFLTATKALKLLPSVLDTGLLSEVPLSQT
jgi:hypothetical protein